MRARPPAVQKFAKYEGIGNDFILVETDDAAAFSPERVRALCDRHHGIGADGVILILPARVPEAAKRMLILNADGSIPEMCGNGIRCVALALTQGSQCSSSVTIETDAGLRHCAVEKAENSGLVTVDMGDVRMLTERALDVEGERLVITEATAGNPHAILWGNLTRERMASLGQTLCTHADYPEGTNVEFALIENGEITLVVWERGVGFTLACGTGAAATAVAAWQKGLLPKASTRVHLPGGTLTIAPTTEQNSRLKGCSMQGPARLVFSGITHD
jgi:diaminopimelate epimerase